MAKTIKPIAKQFQIKRGCQIQHVGVSYGEGAIAPFDSDDTSLVLFHAANIELVESDQLLDQQPEKLVETAKFTEDAP